MIDWFWWKSHLTISLHFRMIWKNLKIWKNLESFERDVSQVRSLNNLNIVWDSSFVSCILCQYMWSYRWPQWYISERLLGQNQKTKVINYFIVVFLFETTKWYWISDIEMGRVLKGNKKTGVEFQVTCWWWSGTAGDGWGLFQYFKFSSSVANTLFIQIIGENWDLL